ncbi:MAG: hypothetical protein AMXMBFR64_57300 [Myxococcales bacterium]
MSTATARLGAGGRVVIPGEFRRALGLRVGDEVVVVLEADGLRVMSSASAVRRAQALIAPFVPVDVSLSDELIAERREEERSAE